ncbi:hypothetical protein DAEQUDRAFT_767910 [Daedalea quercina L-15889]|uniref:Uncharacterized protein n=1 Tax=Daedalea quercina L-15889 TaxID=1314783 RepID=A0A165N5W8_9APHY|nr:hypothetical protein DAEQUDRAFT_767910 [Daedalea quercina L-15889]
MQFMTSFLAFIALFYSGILVQAAPVTLNGRNYILAVRNGGDAQTKAAAEVWSAIEKHTMQGEDAKGQKKRGRHLSSGWFETNPQTLPSVKIEDKTSLARVTWGKKGSGKKTLFIDAPISGHADTAHIGKWTDAAVANACLAAIKASMGSGTEFRPGKYSVATPFGHNICLLVTKDSCYANDIEPTNAPAGSKC